MKENIIEHWFGVGEYCHAKYFGMLAILVVVSLKLAYSNPQIALFLEFAGLFMLLKWENVFIPAWRGLYEDKKNK